MKKVFVICFLVFMSLSSLVAENKEIIMSYKTDHKLPLIGPIGDDSGLYKELFGNAATKIGFDIKIDRSPKKRVHAKLARGINDFYPGASFSTKRAKYLYYLPNGLQTKEVVLTRTGVKEITDLSQLNGRLLVELGSSKYDLEKKYKTIELVRMREMTMETIVKALRGNRADYYIADIEIVDFYKKEHNIKSYKDIGIQIHENAVNKKYIPMYMGFSRKSKLFLETPNPNFDETKPVTIQNFPTIISKDCVAYKFYKALVESKQKGTTQEIYAKYFK